MKEIISYKFIHVKRSNYFILSILRIKQTGSA